MKIPESAVQKFVENLPPHGVQNPQLIEEYFKLYDDEDELDQIDEKLEEVQKTTAELKARRVKAKKAFENQRRKVDDVGNPKRRSKRLKRT